jgi:hypothetical protein
MALSRQQIIQLYTGGTVPIPSPFPDVGAVSIRPDGYRLKPKGDQYSLVRVRYRVSPNQRITYVVRLEHVAAILWADDEGKVDPIHGDWWVGPEIQAQLKATSEATGSTRADGGADIASPLGIVYVNEHDPVLVQVELATTAGESTDAAIIPCCPR